MGNNLDKAIIFAHDCFNEALTYGHISLDEEDVELLLESLEEARKKILQLEAELGEINN